MHIQQTSMAVCQSAAQSGSSAEMADRAGQRSVRGLWRGMGQGKAVGQKGQGCRAGQTGQGMEGAGHGMAEQGQGNIGQSRVNQSKADQNKGRAVEKMQGQGARQRPALCKASCQWTRTISFKDSRC